MNVFVLFTNLPIIKPFFAYLVDIGGGLSLSQSCVGIAGNGQFRMDGFEANELLLLSYLPPEGRIVEHL